MSVIQNQLNEKGFCLVKQAIPAQKIQFIQRQVRLAFNPQFLRRGIKEEKTLQGFSQNLFRLFYLDQEAYLQTAKICQNLMPIHQLGIGGITDALYAAGLKNPAICTRPVMYFHSKHLAVSEGHWKTEAHQDWRSMQGSLNSLVVWVPLVDIDKDLGPLEVVPGSHKLGLLETEPNDWYRRLKDTSKMEFEPVEVEAGDALYFSAFLVHRSGENVTDKIRWSCHFRYNDLSEPTFVNRKYPSPYIYKPQQDLMTPDFPKLTALDKIF